MKARGGGAIVNFYSIDAQTGAWLHSDYNMNKGAILGLTRSAAEEWGRFNIRTNAIAPTGLGQVFAQLVNDVPGFLAIDRNGTRQKHSHSCATRKPFSAGKK